MTKKEADSILSRARSPFPKTKAENTRELLLRHYTTQLIDKVGIEMGNPRQPFNHYELMKQLNERDFRRFLERDKDREKDGLYLRNELFRQEAKSFLDDWDREFRDKPCSVLEMMVAFAVRIDQEYIGDPSNPHSELVFWKMIQNLKLDRMNDRSYAYDYNGSRLNTDSTIDVVLFRNYRPDGTGGFFPLPGTQRDQTGVNLWSQMNEYVGRGGFV